jgi:hypothetical protein
VGRSLAFADADVIRTLQNAFVPVTGDDWYQRRRQDKVGEFFRKVSDQSERRGASTRQALYCFTADGDLIGFGKGYQADYVKNVLKDALAKWQALPESKRKPKPFNEDPGKPDPQFDRRPPEGTVIVRVYARELEHEGASYKKAAPHNGIGMNQASLDHLWIKPEEAKALITSLTPGEKITLPPTLIRRIARFHLVDNTRGEPDFWPDIGKTELSATVESVKKGILTLKLSGSFQLKRGDMGFEGTLGGSIAYDTGKRTWVKFELTAVGEHWGQSTYCHGARPGKAPVGIATVLADGKQEADKIPPQAARDIGTYFGND